MSMPTDPPSVQELLEAQRELSEAEQARLRMWGQHSWMQVSQLMSERARAAYSVAPEEVFRHCVTFHLDDEARAQMMSAEVYGCPQCGTLLKDRQSMAASAILGERKRLADLWLAVEASRDRPAYAQAFRAFRAALGLPDKGSVGE